jgi:hypothetical protein
VNRFLLSKMAEEGHGEVEFVTSPDEAQPAADRFYERVHSPVLTNISIDWQGLPVAEVYPAQLPDLFSAKPIIVTGRYTRAATGSLVIHGTRAGGPFTRTIQVDFPAENASHAALEKIWARRKVDDLMSQDWMGIQQGNSKYKAQIVDVGLKHSLATQYTSFVAVETKTVIQDGKPVRIEVPVELPEGVSPLAMPSGSLGTPVGMVANSGTTAYYRFNTTDAMTTVEVSAAPKGVETESAQQVYDMHDWVQEPRAPGGSGRNAKKDKQVAAQKLLESKLSADLLSLYQCSQKRGAAKSGQKCNLPASGNVEVEVKLSTSSAELEQRLTAAGLSIKSGSGTPTLTGEIAIAELKALAEIAEVTSVTKLEHTAMHVHRPR